MLSFKVHGKWILAGEHAVLRGAPALVFPLASRYLAVDYEPGAEELIIELRPSSPELHGGVWAVLDKALATTGRSRREITGRLVLTNNIPIGAGMGASATLCVGVAKIFGYLGFITAEEVFAFAKNLEDLFHGKSSGVDVAVAIHNQPLIFTAPNDMHQFNPRWKPHFYLSFCGQGAITADCVRKVQNLFAENRALAVSLDLKMAEAVREAQQALQVGPADRPRLQRAMTMASQCFAGWDLVGEELARHMKFLMDKGALAVKPTGSGGGGFVVSLWADEVNPSLQTALSMIRC